MPEVRCPRCRKRIRYRRVKDVPTFPFCSERCRLLDLGNWFDERYRISEPLADEAGAKQSSDEKVAPDGEDEQGN